MNKDNRKDKDGLLTQLSHIIRAFKGEPVQITLAAINGKISIMAADKMQTEGEEEGEEMEKTPSGIKSGSKEMQGMARKMRNNRKVSYIG